MRRRAFLASFGAGVAATTGGCVADGRVALEITKEMTIKPLTAWWEELPNVGGNGALSLTARADQQFDVYYFTEEAAFSQYRLYIYNRAQTDGATTNGTTAESTENTTTTGGNTTAATTGDSSMPAGHDDISQAAVPKGDSDKYEVQIPDDGGRKTIETEGAHYLAIDHSNYGAGVEVERFQDPLSPFIDLKVIDEESII